MKVPCELTAKEKPRLTETVDETKLNDLIESITQLSKEIPLEEAHKAAKIIGGSGLLDVIPPNTSKRRLNLSRCQPLRIKP